jgi:hypothetical protein
MLAMVKRIVSDNVPSLQCYYLVLLQVYPELAEGHSGTSWNSIQHCAAVFK